MYYKLSVSIGFEEVLKSPDDKKEVTDFSKLDSLIFERIMKKIPPPNPLLPKSFFVEDEGAMTGSMGRIFMLRRFQGKDKKNQLMNTDFHIAGIENTYNSSITLSNIFSPYDEEGEWKKEIVYYRNIGKDQNKALTIAEINKKGNIFNTNKLDVKRLLKTQISLNGKKNEDSAVVSSGLSSFYKKSGESDQTLMFESRFESGNLYSVMKVTDNEYHLCLQNDVNTVGHTQWFFFRVQNTKKDLEVQFNILNLAKPDSLFNHGMKPLIYSEK